MEAVGLRRHAPEADRDGYAKPVSCRRVEVGKRLAEPLDGVAMRPDKSEAPRKHHFTAAEIPPGASDSDWQRIQAKSRTSLHVTKDVLLDVARGQGVVDVGLRPSGEVVHDIRIPEPAQRLGRLRRGHGWTVAELSFEHVARAVAFVGVIRGHVVRAIGAELPVQRGEPWAFR